LYGGKCGKTPRVELNSLGKEGLSKMLSDRTNDGRIGRERECMFTKKGR